MKTTSNSTIAKFIAQLFGQAEPDLAGAQTISISPAASAIPIVLEHNQATDRVSLQKIAPVSDLLTALQNAPKHSSVTRCAMEIITVAAVTAAKDEQERSYPII